MSGNNKILNLEAVLEKRKELSRLKKKLVLCHGHFNLIHPGHLRFLHFAREKGDYLLIAVTSDKNLDQPPTNFFPEDERAKGVAYLDFVDGVTIVHSDLSSFLEEVTPDYFIMGREFEDHIDLISKEIQAVEKKGGKVLFGAGEITYAPHRWKFDQTRKINAENASKFLDICKRHGVDLASLQQKIKSFENLKIAVIGDSIVDEFVACDSLGISSEAPVQVLREIESKKFIGGAAIVSQHVKSLGAECSFFSILGQDAEAEFVEKTLNNFNINTHFIKDENRPTTFKKRYMVDNQKLLRVSRLKQHQLTKKQESFFIQKLEETLPGYHGIIISDFVYGMITPKILQAIKKIGKANNIKIFGDLQCSSQFGDVSKFKEIDLITPTEKEARIALNDENHGLEKIARDLLTKTRNKSLVLTLGEQGLLVYFKKEKDTSNHQSLFFPALIDDPVDVAGAGDALLTGFVLSLCSELSMIESTLIASSMAAIAITRIGNIAITKDELGTFLTELKKYNTHPVLNLY